MFWGVWWCICGCVSVSSMFGVIFIGLGVIRCLWLRGRWVGSGLFMILIVLVILVGG